MNKTFLALIFAAAMAVSIQAAPMGTAFTYQGRLNDGGAPATGLYDFNFKLFTGPGNADPQVGSDFTIKKVPVTNGLFTVKLDFLNPNLFPGDARWLEIWANTNGQSVVKLDPRQELTPQPYAIFAGTAATVTNQAITTLQLAPGAVTTPQLGTVGAPNPGQVLSFNGSGLAWTTPAGAQPAWLLTGNGGTDSNVNFLGTTDNTQLVLRAYNQIVMRYFPHPIGPDGANLVGGAYVNSALGGAGSVICGGGAPGLANVVANDHSAIVGGLANLIQGRECFIGGGQDNTISDLTRTNTHWVVIGGGSNNVIANTDFAFIGGGGNNAVSGPYSTISGGGFNTISTNLSYETIAGGYDNYIGPRTAFPSTLLVGYSSMNVIGGGSDNTIEAFPLPFVSGYGGNTIAGGQGNGVKSNLFGATIAGGVVNLVNSHYTVIGGGFQNSISSNSSYAAIAGGQYNVISENSAYATIGGGSNNVAAGLVSTVAGGQHNLASAQYATSIGGKDNQATGIGSMVGGGLNNLGSGRNSTIGGGSNNFVSGFVSTVAGGQDNSVSGHLSAIGGGTGNRNTANYTTIGGGFGNLAAGQDAVVAGGSGNFATAGQSTVGGGIGNQVSGSAATIAGGQLNNNQATFGVIGGGTANTIGTNADTSVIGGGQGNKVLFDKFATVAGGVSNVVLNMGNFADYATIPGGLSARARNYGQQAYASGQFAQAGDAQASLYVLRGITTNNIQGDLNLDGNHEVIYMPFGSVWALRIQVSAAQVTGTNFAAYEASGVVANVDGTAAVLYLRDGAGNGLLTGKPIFETPNAVNWQATPYVNGGVFGATGFLRLAVNGAVGQGPIKWVATVQATELVK